MFFLALLLEVVNLFAYNSCKRSRTSLVVNVLMSAFCSEFCGLNWITMR